MTAHLTSGLAWRGSVLEWTVLRPAKDGPVASPPRHEAAGEGDPAARKAALQSAARHLSGSIALALPSSDMLFRILEFPPASADEIGGMVDLQMDKVSPYPMDQMATGWEVFHRTDSGVRVLAAAIPLDRLDALCRPMIDAGLTPDRIDAAILCGWQSLREANAIPPGGLSGALMLEPGSADLIVFQDGEPVAFMSLGSAAMETDAAAQALAEDVRFALESQGLWQDSIPLQIWGSDGSQAPANRLRMAFGPHCTVRSAESLPTLSEGVARRAQIEDGLNLLPREWRDQAARQKVRRRFFGSLAGLIGFFLLAAAAVATAQTVLRHRTAGLEAEVKRLDAPAQEVRTLKERVAALELYGNRKDSVLECLLDVVKAMPPSGVELTSLTFRKGASLSLRGQAVSPDPVYDFLQALQRLSRFSEVQSSPVQTRSGSDPMPVQFSINCTFPGAPEHEPVAP